jgi:hypothetical protein
MDIDIESLSEEQLIALNNLIVARLRFLQDQRAHSAMLEFRVGQRVAFQPPGRPLMHGVLTRYNKKTVTVITDAGEHWNVAPDMLWPAAPAGGAKGRGAAVVPLNRRR